LSREQVPVAPETARAARWGERASSRLEQRPGYQSPRSRRRRWRRRRRDLQRPAAGRWKVLLLRGWRRARVLVVVLAVAAVAKAKASKIQS
jgi:hypothetical protein